MPVFTKFMNRVQFSEVRYSPSHAIRSGSSCRGFICNTGCKSSRGNLEHRHWMAHTCRSSSPSSCLSPALCSSASLARRCSTVTVRRFLDDYGMPHLAHCMFGSSILGSIQFIEHRRRFRLPELSRLRTDAAGSCPCGSCPESG